MNRSLLLWNSILSSCPIDTIGFLYLQCQADIRHPINRNADWYIFSIFHLFTPSEVESIRSLLSQIFNIPMQSDVLNSKRNCQVTLWKCPILRNNPDASVQFYFIYPHPNRSKIISYFQRIHYQLPGQIDSKQLRLVRPNTSDQRSSRTSYRAAFCMPSNFDISPIRYTLTCRNIEGMIYETMSHLNFINFEYKDLRCNPHTHI